MGNCCSIKKKLSFSKSIASMLVVAIEINSLEKIKEIIIKYTISSGQQEPIFDINNAIVKIYSQDMNALGYSLFLGHHECFSMIYELGRAKLSSMVELYKPLNKRPIDIICELGHKKLLQYYLPIYLNKSDMIENFEEESISLSFTRSKNIKSIEKGKSLFWLSSMNAVQHACSKGKIGILQFLRDYFLNSNVPSDFDVHHQDDVTGDNCALVACRTGMIDLIKYLNEKCNANFHVVNKRKENAIQILAVWSKKLKQRSFLPCFQYLIDFVGVDFKYEIEETILILEDKEIIQYLEGKLILEGFSINKRKLDEKYSLSQNRIPPIVDPILEQKLSKIKGDKFKFREIFKEELEILDENNISSIHINQSLHDLSLISLLDVRI